MYSAQYTKCSQTVSISSPFFALLDTERLNHTILCVGGPANLSPRSNIVRKIDAGDRSYPSVNMCVHYLKLPDYTSKEVMREKMLIATKDKRHLFELQDFESNKYHEIR